MFDPVIAQQLRKRGHDVDAIAELSELRALSDREILASATRSDRVLVSENVQELRFERNLQPLVRQERRIDASGEVKQRRVGSRERPREPC
jgi:menaquinone-dependent protoporphyrinogen IX oxidase